MAVNMVDAIATEFDNEGQPGGDTATAAFAFAREYLTKHQPVAVVSWANTGIALRTKDNLVLTFSAPPPQFTYDQGRAAIGDQWTNPSAYVGPTTAYGPCLNGPTHGAGAKPVF